MSAHANPDIIDDNLVFMYDTDDGKSYKGEPTVNLITNSGTSNTGWVGYGWTGSQAISSDYSNTYEFTATNGWHNRTFDTGVTSGGTIYVSFQYKLKQQQTTQNQIFVLNGTHLGSYTNYIGNGSMSFEWQTFSGSFTANANSSKIAIGPRGQDSSGLTDIVYIRNLQVEQKPHATQFVNGTRSATQGLIDRTGTSTIDLSNVSFDSDAQITFDGTDDYIDLGDLELGGDPFTVEAVIYPKASSTYHVFFRKGDNSTSNTNMDWSIGYDYNQFHFRTQNASVSINEYAGASFVNNYGHVVLTYDGSTIRMYLNGSEVSNKTVTLANNYSNYSIGRGINNYAQLDVKTLKVYNKALTAAEVLQNFNATKSRFGL